MRIIIMSLEILDQLEAKIKQAVETIQLLQMERSEELKEQKANVEQANQKALQSEKSNLMLKMRN